MRTVPEPRASLDAASDELLADRAADGDDRAFAVLVTRYAGLLRAYAIRVLGTPTQADDVVQDALITAWHQLDTLTERAAVRAWLIRITTRKALDAARGSRHHDDVDDLELPAAEDAGPERLSEAADLSSALAHALRTLPETQRRVWTMRELGGYAYEEIAAELDLPVSTVRGALARARIRLIGLLEGWR